MQTAAAFASGTALNGHWAFMRLCGWYKRTCGWALTLAVRAYIRSRHADEIAAGRGYCLFVIGHDRRRILHFNVTEHPASRWIVQQLREAFPFESAPRFLIFDRDSKYGAEVLAAVRSLTITPTPTSLESPWQNGVAERWIESCRRDLLDHVIALNQQHLKRLLSDYVGYYHEDRTHLGLGKGTPDNRSRMAASGPIVVTERSLRSGRLKTKRLAANLASHSRPLCTDRVNAEVLSTIAGFLVQSGAAFPVFATRKSQRFRCG